MNNWELGYYRRGLWCVAITTVYFITVVRPIYMYIYCHPQTVSLYYNPSVWLDTWDAPSRDQNPPNFTSGWWHTPKSSPRLNVSLGINAYVSNFVCLHFAQSDTEVLNSLEELLHYASGKLKVINILPSYYRFITISFMHHLWNRNPNHHHHHHVTPPARISLTLSRHPSLSSIAPGRSSRLHPVSSHQSQVLVIFCQTS